MCDMRKQIGLFLAGIAVMMLFVSCGKEKGQEAGIDGYINVADQVSLEDIMASALTWQEAGGKLYCAADSYIYDIAVEQALDLRMTQANITDVGDRVRNFSVDRDGNIYWDSMSRSETRCLHKYLAKTGEDVQIPLALGDESIGAIVADQNGRIYLLLDNEILGLDGDGNVVSRFPGEQYRWQDDGSRIIEKLTADSQGNLFYLQNVILDTRVRVLCQDAREWVELTGLPEAFGVGDFFLTGEGKILISADDALYEYDLKDAKSTAVLRYSESSLDKNDIRNIIYVDEEHFLAVCTNTKTEMYLLTRTPVEEVPQKKEIVLASLYPSSELKSAVAAFNRMSEEYTVVIERYGAGNPVESDLMRAAKTRLNGSLVSSDPPDLLDMSSVWATPYLEKNVLADLYPYFEKSSVLDIGDYLENVVEGCTVNGRLVCLPISFTFTAAVGRTSQVGSSLGWTFEDLKSVSENYPGMRIFTRGRMYRFLYDHYVNTFIDLETGRCDFDSDEFREIVQWVERYKLPDEEWLSFLNDYVPADVLLDEVPFRGFMEIGRERVRFGEDVTLIGFVTKAQTPSYSYLASDEMGIVDNSKDKDGAWAFLEYFISNYQGEGFPTNREALMKMAESAMEVRRTVKPDGEASIETQVGTWRLGNEPVPKYAATQEDVDIILEIIDNIDFSHASSSLDEIVSILLEELAPYYNGQKSLEEATRIFNSRVQIIVDEGM